MKIALVINQMRAGGMERVAATLLDEFVKRGHHCILITSLKHAVAYKLNEDVVIKDFYVRSKYRNLARIRSVVKIRKICSDIRPDVVIGFYLPVCLINLGLRIPTIQSEHTTYYRKLSFWFDFRRYYVNRLAQKVTLLSQKDYELLKDKMSNIVVMPNPVPVPVIVPDTQNRDKTVLAVGGINRWYVKGFDRLLDVWRQISHQYPDWRLKIVGGGDEENFSYLKALAAEKSIKDTVVFVGYNQDMAKQYLNSSIFVLTSRNEGFPMGLAEAMSYGCACVAFDILTGPSDIIIDGKNGILVEDGDSKAIAAAIASLIENKILREEMGKRAMKSMDQFSTSVIADKWESIFHEIVKQDKHSNHI